MLFASACGHCRAILRQDLSTLENDTQAKGSTRLRVRKNQGPSNRLNIESDDFAKMHSFAQFLHRKCQGGATTIFLLKLIVLGCKAKFLHQEITFKQLQTFVRICAFQMCISKIMKPYHSTLCYQSEQKSETDSTKLNCHSVQTVRDDIKLFMFQKGRRGEEKNWKEESA